MSNPESKENAGAAGTASGVCIYENGSYRGQDNSPSFTGDAIPQNPKDPHARAARTLFYSLSLGTPDAWLGAAYVFSARLNRQERAALAYAALKSLEDDTAYMTASAALFGVLRGEVLA